MFDKTLERAGVALFLVGLVSGCSWGGSSSRASLQCAVNKSSCMYEGRYDPDEEQYAEQEAARLNKQEQGRLRSQ